MRAKVNSERIHTPICLLRREQSVRLIRRGRDLRLLSLSFGIGIQVGSGSSVLLSEALVSVLALLLVDDKRQHAHGRAEKEDVDPVGGTAR